ncbi:hypothetical protein TNCV_389161 [Trichonephila clavipes]|nr:hypothetical protein TNCV_389161 [Trichonephila clavipes]
MMDNLGEEALVLVVEPIFTIVGKSPSLQSFLEWTEDVIFRGQIKGALLARSGVTKTSHLLGFSKGTVSEVMTAYTQRGKTSWVKQNSGGKEKFCERD